MRRRRDLHLDGVFVIGWGRIGRWIRPITVIYSQTRPINVKSIESRHIGEIYIGFAGFYRPLFLVNLARNKGNLSLPNASVYFSIVLHCVSLSPRSSARSKVARFPLCWLRRSRPTRKSLDPALVCDCAPYKILSKSSPTRLEACKPRAN